MVECPKCGSVVRHELAAHECGDKPDRFATHHPWFGMVLDDAGELVTVHEDTHFQLADGSYIRKDEI